MPQRKWFGWEVYGLQHDGPTVVQEDNKGCLDLAGNPHHHQQTKHIDIQYHFIREKIEEGVLELVQCPTAQQLGDIFTKPLVVDKHYKFAELLLEFCDWGGVLESLTYTHTLIHSHTQTWQYLHLTHIVSLTKY